MTHKADLVKPITFPAWAFSTLSKLSKAVGIGGLIFSAIAISYLEPTSWPEKWWNGGIDELLKAKHMQRANLAFVQTCVCVLLAFMTPNATLPAKFPNIDDRAAIARRACSRIKHLVIILFSLWAAYYAVTGISLLDIDDLIDRPFLITLSGLTSLCLFWLYLEMGEITIETAPEESTHLDASTYRTMAVGVYIILVAVAWFGYARRFEKVIDVVDLAIAALSGIGLCFVVGRFSDKLLNPGPLTLLFLYLYAVLQLGAALFAKEPIIHLVVTTLALPLKILLWLVCVWAFTTGILGEYVYEMRLLIERVDAVRFEENDRAEQFIQPERE